MHLSLCCPVFSLKKSQNVVPPQYSYTFQYTPYTIKSKETFTQALRHRSELENDYIGNLKKMNSRSKKSFFSNDPVYQFERCQNNLKDIRALDNALKSSNNRFNTGQPLNLDTIETLNNRAGVYTNRL